MESIQSQVVVNAQQSQLQELDAKLLDIVAGGTAPTAGHPVTFSVSAQAI